MKLDLPKLPDGFSWEYARNLTVGQFFFYRKGGLRQCVLIKREGLIDYKIMSVKPNGVNYTRNVSVNKRVIIYSK